MRQKGYGAGGLSLSPHGLYEELLISVVNLGHLPEREGEIKKVIPSTIQTTQP